MARTVLSPSPATVAQQLSDLLQCFPAAAIGGVQWKTLLQKYEERFNTRLDLGHTCALAATTTFLFEVLRMVDSEDGDNPVVAVQDDVALAPKPGSAASWPSLYQVLCKILREHGSEDEEGQKAILVSQLKPLLQRHWHSTFDEASFAYLTEEGSSVKMKKMKHLLQALTRWRNDRIRWGVDSGSEMEQALKCGLELVPSKRHNDLLLRERAGEKADLGIDLATPEKMINCPRFEEDDQATEASPQISSRASSVSTMSSAVHEELRALRAENEKLRSRNFALESNMRDQDCQYPDTGLHENLFDNPFEPPPQMWSPTASTAATVAHSGFHSEVGTPVASGCATPVPMAPVGQVGQAITLVPMGWFAMGDRGMIPCGLVQQARAVFEQHTAIPNWFTGQ